MNFKYKVLFLLTFLLYGQNLLAKLPNIPDLPELPKVSKFDLQKISPPKFEPPQPPQLDFSKFHYDYFPLHDRNSKSIQREVNAGSLSSWSPLFQTTLATAVAGILIAFSYFVYSQDAIKYKHGKCADKDYIKNKYPYAYLWYQQCVQKYKQFDLMTFAFLVQESSGWSYFEQAIVCNDYELSKINDLYKIKSSGKKLGEYEIYWFAQQEKHLIEQVAHIYLDTILWKHSAAFLSLSVVQIGKYAFQEAYDQAYLEKIRSQEHYSVESSFLSILHTHSDVVNHHVNNRYMAMFMISWMLSYGLYNYVINPYLKYQINLFVYEQLELETLQALLLRKDLLDDGAKNLIFQEIASRKGKSA